jgi:hypothetical protein
VQVRRDSWALRGLNRPPDTLAHAAKVVERSPALRGHVEKPFPFAASPWQSVSMDRRDAPFLLEPVQSGVHRADRYVPPGHPFYVLLDGHAIGGWCERAHGEEYELLELAKVVTAHAPLYQVSSVLYRRLHLERFGRGRHQASLNFGDCLAYAAAVTAGDALLFVGDDFRHTDVRVA